jgi:flagellar FliL protein
MANTAPTPTTTPTTTPTPTPKKSKKGLLAIVAAVVLLGGGGGAYWTFAKGDSADGDRAEQAETPASAPEAGPGAAIALDTFVVNLAGSGRSHFLRVSLTLIVGREEVAAEFAGNEVVKLRVRSAILELLALQTADTLVTPEGKTALKTAITEAANHTFPELQVNDVLFSEFVVQY